MEGPLEELLAEYRRYLLIERGLADSALRSLLRYLHVAGLIELPLVWAVPAVANLRDRSLPRGIEPPINVFTHIRATSRRRPPERRSRPKRIFLREACRTPWRSSSPETGEEGTG
ncbi:MAG: hypothetical protein WBP81_04765 [Solirubrobacteraceae bacterium]